MQCCRGHANSWNPCLKTCLRILLHSISAASSSPTACASSFTFQVPVLVLAFDNATVDLCEQFSIPYTVHAINGSDFCGNEMALRQMGAVKARFVLGLLQQYQVDTIVVSDTDVVWIRDPTE